MVECLSIFTNLFQFGFYFCFIYFKNLDDLFFLSRWFGINLYFMPGRSRRNGRGSGPELCSPGRVIVPAARVGSDTADESGFVADTFAALQALGHAARERCAATIVGVTGSVGKTSTKEALYAALDRCCTGKVHRSVKSYNNHTGVPLSLARMPREA